MPDRKEKPTIDMEAERGNSKCRIIVEGDMAEDFEFFKQVIDLQTEFKQRASSK